MRGLATLKDVAELAGVSIKTVSNVVNDYPFITPETRERVERAIKETGYQPNVGARNLRKGRTGFIVLAIPELDNPYFAELTGLVITAAHQRDWTVLVEQTHGLRDRERAVITSMGPQRIDAAILSPLTMEPDDLLDASPATPLVLLGERDIAGPADHVAIDNVAAAKAAVEHLITLGRRRVALIGDQPGKAGGTAALRVAGYRQALAEAGLPCAPELVVPAENYQRGDGAAAMAHLLGLPEPPDAVFCCNDLLAIGAIRAGLERGVAIPNQVAVAGFDDIAEGAYGFPSLTTIAPDKAAIAESALSLADRRVGPRGPQPAQPQDVQAPFTLKIRESTQGFRQ
ncbi:LacI family DNA-binding transcriptional regulator [Actinocrispum wychmicini]|uniref:DNA-binding LacI/PurR family transcriptional regulator n=1 Tax=Actinocrispum wychmicini TaxID=1213861 RepID=A0A4R2J7E9_9PSEU|nr:LacI family DNA-binding transcriptional regulator [Actinocrispum wychmicini]TCO54057.1 DNA-binding LacI/PurR family transcriptional regulator [Actinocrispum wychmicini]